MPSLPEYLRPLLTRQPYPHPVGAVQLIETHVSWLFLTGEYAYKIKRPVRYPFIDLRSPGRRAFFCEEELRLNRRFAPELYLEVCRITVQDGLTQIGGEGSIVEYAVRMHQFEGREELDQLLAAGQVEPGELEEFGRDVSRRLATLPVARSPQGWGRPDLVRKLLQENIAQCMQCFASFGTQGEMQALSDPLKAMLLALDPVIESRRGQGRVRECHGDLHCRNVVRYQGRLLAFDCMEFEPAFRWIDVAEEVAFLLMDLHVQHAPRHAHAFLAGFLAQDGDFAACRLLRLYGIHRALVRAKVAALEATPTSSPDELARAASRHRGYLAEARRLLEVPHPTLVLMSGLSGSGKTWLARQLAPELEAVHLRSDVERKRIAGVAEQERSGSGIGQELYSRDFNAKVMERLLVCAADVLEGGFNIIVDATFGQRSDRERFCKLAAAHGVDIVLLHCRAPRMVLESRILGRQRAGGDASEADLAVLAWQESRREAITPEECMRVIDADTTESDIVSKILGMVRQPAAA
jgi:uncharacterized protein